MTQVNRSLLVILLISFPKKKRRKKIKLAIVKSKLIKQLKKSYPNILVKDLEKITKIILEEIKKALKRSERVELRTFGIFLLKHKKHSSEEILKHQRKLLFQKRK